MSLISRQNPTRATSPSNPGSALEAPQLSCIVLARDIAHHRIISTWLGLDKRVASVTAVYDSDSLEHHLNSARSELCIVVAEQRDNFLPKSLKTQAELKTLVLTDNRKTGSVAKWLQQGATDVVSLKKPTVAQHAITRMIDESVMRKSSPDISLEPASPVQSSQESKAIQKKSFDRLAFKTADTTVSNPSQVRASLLGQFDSQLRQPGKKRLSAMSVCFFADDTAPAESSVAKDIQALILKRASSLLKRQLSPKALLGQLNYNTLLLVLDNEHIPVSRNAANVVRDALGNLGGLLESASDIRIHTITVTSNTSNDASSIIARLEANLAAHSGVAS